MMGECFFDTYALFEFIRGNPRYARYTEIITGLPQLMELHYGLLRKAGIEMADRYFEFFLPFVVNIGEDAYRDASILRVGMGRRSVSYIDCLGLAVARRRGVPFLTGDKEFESIKGVEFLR